MQRKTWNAHVGGSDRETWEAAHVVPVAARQEHLLQFHQLHFVLGDQALGALSTVE
jgi:hypothetical protein